MVVSGHRFERHIWSMNQRPVPVITELSRDLRSSRIDPVRSRRVWAISLAIWSFPVVAISMAEYLGSATSEGFGIYSLLIQMLQWYYWGIATPFILRFTVRYPLDRKPRRPVVLHHIAVATTMAVTYGSVMMAAVSYKQPVHFATPGAVLRSYIFFIPFGIAIYATIAAIGFALDFHAKLRERELQASQLQARLTEAQLGALRMQLQPHFLFNTLNTIAMLVREGDTQTSVRMLARLSDLLRHLLDDEGDQEVPVREELDFLSRYLEIEQLRFRDRLKVDVVVDEGARDAFVPNLVLQPIVENAIRHGISRRAAASTIALRVARENGSLVMTVRDDGPGLASSFSIGDSHGIGLRNTQTRLSYLYGEAAHMDVRNAQDHGVLVTLRIPYHESPVSNG